MPYQLDKPTLLVDPVACRTPEGLRQGITSIVSTIREKGKTVDIQKFHIDDENIGLEEFRSVEQKFASEIAEISKQYGLLLISTWSGSYDRAKKVITTTREKNPDITIGVGGPHIDFAAMHRPDIKVLFQESPGVNFFAYGEGDQTVRNLVSGKKLEEIPGIAFKENGGKIIQNTRRSLVPNLDILAFPQLEENEIKGKKWTYLETARGCPHACSFCSESEKWEEPTEGSNIRYRRKTPKRVLDELQYYYDQGIREIRFSDSTLGANRDLMTICDGIIEKELKISWTSYARVDEVNKMTSEELQKIKRSGCSTLLIGFEAGNDGVLESSGKKYKTNEAYSVVQRLREVGIKIRGSWIVGLPDETEENFQATLEFAEKLKLDTNAIHAYEDQKRKFEEYEFGPLGLESDMPNQAFIELIEQTDFTSVNPDYLEMHILARMTEVKKTFLLPTKMATLLKRIQRFNGLVLDPEFDTRKLIRKPKRHYIPKRALVGI